VPRSLCLMTQLVLTATAPIMAASAASGVVSGRVVDDQGRTVANARLVLSNPVSGYRQQVRSDAKGSFTFQNVPFNAYHLDSEAAGLQPSHLDVDVHSPLPLVVTVGLRPEGAVVVVEENLRLVEDHPSTHLDIDKSTIERSPAAVQSRAMESILLATPGFIADENGRFHFRGSHGQMTYVVDGIPVSDQLHATFSNGMDPSQVESMEVITGGISAEYGGKPVVVVNLTTPGSAPSRPGSRPGAGPGLSGGSPAPPPAKATGSWIPSTSRTCTTRARPGGSSRASTGSWAAGIRCVSRSQVAGPRDRWRTWPPSRPRARTSGPPARTSTGAWPGRTCSVRPRAWTRRSSCGPPGPS
jgi:hypothetical protein